MPPARMKQGGNQAAKLNPGPGCESTVEKSRLGEPGLVWDSNDLAERPLGMGSADTYADSQGDSCRSAPADRVSRTRPRQIVTEDNNSTLNLATRVVPFARQATAPASLQGI
jgi:hypothetical protein